MGWTILFFACIFGCIVADQIMNRVFNNKGCFFCIGSRNCENCYFCFRCENCKCCINCTLSKLCEYCSECKRCIGCKHEENGIDLIEIES